MRLATALRRRALGLALGVLCLALAACGTHGVAAALSQPVTVTLPASGGTASRPAGTITLTPIHALHVAAYFGGHAIPLTGAKNPAQIRQNACTGPLVVNLSDGTPANAATSAAGSPPASQADPAGGLDMAIEPGDQWYVIVYDHANDPNAAIVACGHPLSGERQYFDLYQAAVGPDGIALGTALFDPIVATRIEISAADASTTQPTAWALRSGSCTGATLASGTLASGITRGSGVVFRPLDTSAWWVSLTQASGSTSCARVGS